MRAAPETGELERVSQVRPLRSRAMVLAATAGPTQVTTVKASEKKV